jgi:hypothetical protein
MMYCPRCRLTRAYRHIIAPAAKLVCWRSRRRRYLLSIYCPRCGQHPLLFWDKEK